MSKPEIAQLAAYLRELKPNPEFAPELVGTEIEIQEQLWEQEQQFQQGTMELARLVQTILPGNITKLADQYPDETIFFLQAATEFQPPMSRQLNALMFAAENVEVRRAAANCLIDTPDEDPLFRETLFRHLPDPDPQVRKNLSLPLRLRVSPPFSADELTRVQQYRDLAESEGASEMAEHANQFLFRATCDGVYKNLGESGEISNP